MQGIWVSCQRCCIFWKPEGSSDFMQKLLLTWEQSHKPFCGFHSWDVLYFRSSDPKSSMCLWLLLCLHCSFSSASQRNAEWCKESKLMCILKKKKKKVFLGMMAHHLGVKLRLVLCLCCTFLIIWLLFFILRWLEENWCVDQRCKYCFEEIRIVKC